MFCFDLAKADARNAREHRRRLFSRVCTKVLSQNVSIAELSIMGCGRPEQC